MHTCSAACLHQNKRIAAWQISRMRLPRSDGSSAWLRFSIWLCLRLSRLTSAAGNPFICSLHTDCCQGLCCQCLAMFSIEPAPHTAPVLTGTKETQAHIEEDVHLAATLPQRCGEQISQRLFVRHYDETKRVDFSGQTRGRT